MDEFDDLDSLLELEQQLLEEEDEDEGGLKRSRADLQSQQDVERSLAGPSGGKRARLAGGAPPHHQQHQHQQPPRSMRTFHTVGATEEQHLLALAADSQPSQSVGGGGGRATTARTFVSLPASEEQRLLALAASSTQPSQSAAAPGHGSGRAATGSRRGAGAGGGVGGGGGGFEDEFDLDAMLDELLEEEEQQRPAAAAAGAAAARTPPAPRPHQQQQAVAAAPAAGSAPPPAAAAPAQQAVPPAAVEFLLPPRQYVPPAKEVYRIRGTSLSITSESGERVYCQLEAPQSGASGSGCGGSTRRVDVAAMLRRARGGLLSDNINTLLAAVEKDQYNRAVAETAAAAAAAAGRAAGRGGSPAAQQGAPGGRGAQSSAAVAGVHQQRQSSLWVEKYGPRGYVDLLSDEQINREVVGWLKSWDPCVFGTAAPEQLAQQARGMGSRFQRPSAFKQQQHGAAGGAGIGSDALGRPEHKVILIAGPPGLGKTTLAHICASHCGYRPVEINASDDRSGNSLQAKILDAVEMQSVMGQRRPNCVIIDEIDGASGGAEGRSGIAALMKIVNALPGKGGRQHGGGGGRGQQEGRADAESDSDNEEDAADDGGVAAERSGWQAGRRKGGLAGASAGGKPPRQQQLRPLLRPIICICNDLYAPALRALRDVAKVFHFKKPQPERLAQRLQSICATEGLRCEKSTLRLLVERTECDIRSCLNTLQFLAKKQCVVRQADLVGLRVGQKDMTKGAFAVWTELLHRRKAPGIIGKAAETESQRTLRLYDSLMDFGENELVLGGVQENVLSLRYFDLALNRTSAVLNHLGDADTFLRACFRTGEFGLLKYVPAPLVAVSNLVAGPDRPQLRWPRASFDMRRRMLANTALLQAWMLGVSPAVAVATSNRSMVLEVLPSLMHIAAPALRPVSQHLYSAQEQEDVRQLVDTMLGYNLRFCLDPAPEEEEQQQQDGGPAAEREQQQRVRGGATAEPPLRFRPAVHRTCTFPGIAAQGKLMPAAVRQTISHEVDMEAIRRADMARRGCGSSNTPLSAAAGGGEAGALGADGRPRQAAPAAAAAQPVGRPVPLTLAERMKASGLAANTVRRQAAARPSNWLDQLKEQRYARTGAAGGSDGSCGSGAGRGHKFPVLYRFHEGYTNAVKRPVLMSDLL